MFNQVKSNRKSMRMVAWGCFTLAASLMLKTLAHPAGQVAKDWLDGVCGLLIGISLGLNLFGVIAARRRAQSHPDPS